MVVIVKLYANFRMAAGVDKVEINGAGDVFELLKALAAKFGKGLAKELFEGKRPRSSVNLMVNGRGADLKSELHKKLTDGDTVMIFPPVSGG